MKKVKNQAESETPRPKIAKISKTQQNQQPSLPNLLPAPQRQPRAHPLGHQTPERERRVEEQRNQPPALVDHPDRPVEDEDVEHPNERPDRAVEAREERLERLRAFQSPQELRPQRLRSPAQAQLQSRRPRTRPPELRPVQAVDERDRPESDKLGCRIPLQIRLRQKLPLRQPRESSPERLLRLQIARERREAFHVRIHVSVLALVLFGLRAHFLGVRSPLARKRPDARALEARLVLGQWSGLFVHFCRLKLRLLPISRLSWLSRAPFRRARLSVLGNRTRSHPRPLRLPEGLAGRDRALEGRVERGVARLARRRPERRPRRLVDQNQRPRLARLGRRVERESELLPNESRDPVEVSEEPLFSFPLNYVLDCFGLPDCARGPQIILVSEISEVFEVLETLRGTRAPAPAEPRADLRPELGREALVRRDLRILGLFSSLSSSLIFPTPLTLLTPPARVSRIATRTRDRTQEAVVERGHAPLSRPEEPAALRLLRTRVRTSPARSPNQAARPRPRGDLHRRGRQKRVRLDPLEVQNPRARDVDRRI